MLTISGFDNPHDAEFQAARLSEWNDDVFYVNYLATTPGNAEYWINKGYPLLTAYCGFFQGRFVDMPE